MQGLSGGKTHIGRAIPPPHIRQQMADVGHPDSSGLENNWLYIQDSKLEGVIPSPELKLYLVWNQMVGRNRKEKTLDKRKLGTKRGVGGKKQCGFRGLT